MKKFIGNGISKIIILAILGIVYIAFAAFQADSSGDLTITATGDLVFPYTVPNPKAVFAGVQGQLTGDAVVGNLEGPITFSTVCAKDTSKPATFAFRYSPDIYPTILKEAGFTVLHLANNHSLDYGDKGFTDTVNYLTKAGLNSLGFKNQILILNLKGKKVAFIGFSYIDLYNNVNRLDQSAALVKKAKETADMVIIVMHAGAEGLAWKNVQNKNEIFYGENRGNVIAFCHTVIDAGADAVIGFGPHTMRAVEYYKNRFISYSLGNFVPAGGLATAGELGYSVILKLTFSADTGLIKKAAVVPVVINSGYPVIDPKMIAAGLLKALTDKYYADNRGGKQNCFVQPNGDIQLINE